MRHLLTAVLTFCLTAAALADAPATRPATAPATRPVYDQSTPMAAIQSLVRANRSADVPAFQQIVYARDAEGRRLSDASAKVLLAQHHLAVAAGDQFGPNACKFFITPTPDPADGVINVDGDRATFATPDGEVMPLVKVDGKWKVALQEALKGSDMTLDQVIRMSEKQAADFEQLAGEVKAGVYPGLESLKRAYGKAILNSVANPEPSGH